jgi:IS30 family transposase
VIKKLKKKWSPEAIAGRMPKDIPGQSIHHETIYRYIYSNATQHAELYQYLKFHRKKLMRG